MKSFLNQLFDYNFYCNKKLIDECHKLEKIPEKSVTLLSHILNAHHIWNSRVLGSESLYEVWQEHPLKEWGDIHYENQRSSFEIITSTDNFEVRIDYENAEGQMFTSTLQDILFHIINHSTHHRSQIALDFRNDGLEPLKLDYILYKR